MQRPASVEPVRRQHSTRAGAKFVYLAEVIGRALEPTTAQLDDLDRAYRATGEYLTTCQEFGGLLYQVHAHGSRQLGTMVRPARESGDGFDIDLAACLDRQALVRYGGPGGPRRLIDDLFTALRRYADRYGLEIRRHDRCVTLTYSGGMTADFAPIVDDPSHVVLHGGTHGRIPDRSLERYVSTNPRGYCKAFDEIASISPAFLHVAELSADVESMRKSELIPLPAAQEVFARLLSRLVQLVKTHRNLAFGPGEAEVTLAPPSSFVTTLVANAYAIEATRFHAGPMDLLMDIVRLMPGLVTRTPLLRGGEHWQLDNPTAQDGNLAACMDSLAKQKAFTAWHGQLSSALQSLVDAIDRDAGLDVVAVSVEGAFGSRARAALVDSNAQRREANRVAGRAFFVVGGGTVVSSAARPNTNFGD